LTIPTTSGATNPDSESVQTHSAGKTPVVYTSRQELVFADVRGWNLAAVSSLLMDIVRFAI